MPLSDSPTTYQLWLSPITALLLGPTLMLAA